MESNGRSTPSIMSIDKGTHIQYAWTRRHRLTVNAEEQHRRRVVLPLPATDARQNTQRKRGGGQMRQTGADKNGWGENARDQRGAQPNGQHYV